MYRPTYPALLLSAFLLGSPPQIAAADTTPATATINIDELRSRLNLTPEQQTQIAPYADKRKAKMEELRSKVSGSASRRDKRAALQEAKQAQEEFIKNVEPLLTPEQQTEWKKIREEVRAELKERWRNRP